jgi:hypothetical protein
MAHENTVLHSFETPDGAQCVDLFRRPDGGYGFETYRRDIEDGRGWFPTGQFSRTTFATETDALDAARAGVPWLRPLLDAAGIG